MTEEFNVEIKREGKNVRALFTGRLDAITAENIQKTFESMIDDGERVIIADLTNVSYISSAGIRAFLFIQKKLMVISGEIILYNPQEIVKNIISVSGLDRLFTVVSADQELPGVTDKYSKEVSDVFEGITFEHRHISNEKGKLHHFGNGEKLKYATYTRDDVITKKNF